MRSLLPMTAAVLLGSCAQQGDFGRPADGAWNQFVDATGSIAARGRKEPASLFPFTDEERVLRDRAWRFLMPAAEQAAFDDVLANLTRTRVLPPAWAVRPVDSYHATLVDTDFRSEVSRYRRLSEDATADGRLIPLFAATAKRVIEADGLRLRSLPFARDLADADVREAAMRVAENRCLIAWVRLEAGYRVSRYRYSLEHLLIEMPAGREAALVERNIAFLDSRRGLLSALLPADAEERCGLTPPPAPVAGLAGPVVARY